MAGITLDSATQDLRDLFHKGMGAMERGNLDYAINMFAACIEREPRLVDVRRFLYAAEIKKFRSGKTSILTHVASTLRNLPLLIQASVALRAGAAMQSLGMLEGLLRRDPLNLRFITLYCRAADAADMRELAIQTLTMARDHYPDNTDLIFWLGNLHMASEQVSEARECFERVVAMRPNDGAALRALKNSLALQTLNRDGLGAAETTRAVIRDVREAEILEKEAKAVRTESDTDELIAEAEAKIQREPDNVSHYRALASLYAENRRFEQAVATLEQAQRVRNSSDPEIDAALSLVRLREMDERIAELASLGDKPGADALRAKRNEFVFDDVNDRVNRYPNDLQLRYELGVAFFGRERINEAIQQFQLSQRNPRWHTRSLYYLGLCFKQKRQYDLAVEQLEKASAELVSMDATKKDIVYELGLIHEAMGDASGAHEYYKQIYQVDISYRDVARRVEQAYSRSSA